MGAFLLDSNFFIEAHRTTYPLDVVTSFWSKLIELSESGHVKSIDKVRNEIFRNDDPLKQWCEINLPDTFFIDTSTILNEYTSIIGWAAAQNGRYLQSAITDFLQADEADAWLIAKCLSDKNNVTLVTHEVSNPQRKNRIMIPDVCMVHGIQYCNTIEMFRQLGQRF